MLRRLGSLAIAFLLALPAAAQLAGEASRYLKDAAASPVKWQAWGEGAFGRAKREK
ncbi:MAG: hypothetical protein QOH21_3323, partial [Acidobacteriota bacterium]|nr:hypothetical protein [Acidobacteriota bacterium]